MNAFVFGLLLCDGQSPEALSVTLMRKVQTKTTKLKRRHVENRATIKQCIR